MKQLLRGKAKKLFHLATPAVMTLATLIGYAPAVHAAPTVNVTSPINNTTQQGVITLEASASADTLGVTFKINGPYVSFTSVEDTTAPFSATWDSAGISLNKIDYTVTAVARSAGGSTTSAPVKVKLDNIPFANKVIVVGDSVSQQAFDWDADGTFNYTSGAPAAGDLLASPNTIHMGWAVPNVQTTVNNYSIFRWPQKLVVAMGLNDAGVAFGADGWTNDDTERFRTLINTVHSTTCVTIVLPGHAATGNSPWFAPWTAEIDEARVALAQLATERPHTTTIDWQAVIDQHPEYVDEDGIHLKTDATDDLEKAAQNQMNPVHQDAAEARQNFYWTGAAQCTL